MRLYSFERSLLRAVH